MNQDLGLNRNNNIDKYYTKIETVKLCIDTIKKSINIKNNELIIEPSAGNGAFIDSIKSLSNNYIFYDIYPENNEIIQQDFLKLNINKGNNKIHIIGNPPFGRQSCMTIKFIKKCCEFADSISFILPKSFKKDSMKKYFDLHFHLINQIDLPENSFIVNDTEYNVPCILQIWKYKKQVRESIKKLKCENFKFVKQNENPDVSFRRVGVNAGKVDTEDIVNKSIESHYFIKFDNNISENINILKNIKFDTDNTVGPKSISKQEIIKNLNIEIIN